MFSDSLRTWQDAGDYWLFRGHRVFYKVCGEGEPLLLVHGFPSASVDWQAIWPQLEGKFQLIAMDMLGYGFSDKPKDFDYSISAQADLVAELAERLNIRKAHILSHDYGDTVAQELLARHLEGSLTFEIRSLSLLNGGLFPETHKPLLIQKLLMSPIGPLLAKFMNHKKFTASLQKICSDGMTSDVLDDLWQLLEYKNGRAVLPLLIYYMQERREHRERWVGALEQANAMALPLHLIDGVIDPISGQHLVERYRELLPEAKVTELQNIGHYPQVEAPDTVVSAFLAGLNEAQTSRREDRSSDNAQEPQVG